MTRVALFDRLPAIHKIKDAELAAGDQPGPLQAYLSHVEDALSAVKDSIEALYHDLFIETCAEWVIPYIGDLLGASHLAGDPWTLRADIADTIALRRMKGTLAAIQQLAFDLTGWGSHPVELRENLAWAQALNHQRPDRGGLPAYGDMPAGRHTIIRGGFATIRDPAALSLLGTPFDQFARFPDVSISAGARVGYNLPNLAVFLWRLATYQVECQRTLASPSPAIAAVSAPAPAAPFVARFFCDPLARPVRLFGRSGFDPQRRPPILTPVDAQPAPIARARLTTPSAAGQQGSFGGNPSAYVAAVPYDETQPLSIVVDNLALQLHIPSPSGGAGPWTFRGTNLCAWEAGLAPPLAANEIAIDPLIGRIAIGAATQPIAQALVDHVALTYTYAAVGSVGAHPTARDTVPTATAVVDPKPGSPTLTDALGALATTTTPIVIEIDDDEVHDLDLGGVTGNVDENGATLVCPQPLIVYAAPNRRPIIRLAKPLRFRAADPANARGIAVTFDGLTFVAGTAMAATDPLIARAAIDGLDLRNCTLEPGGDRTAGGTRRPSRTALRLTADHGFPAASPVALTTSIQLTQTIAGPIFVDPDAYSLNLSSSIVDAGPDAATGAPAVAGAGDPTTTFSAAAVIDGVTIFGRSRFARLSGRGGIFDGQLFVDDDQTGCLKQCWFSDDGDRLPQNSECVSALDAYLAFTSEVFGNEAYGQLSRDCDSRILERGPNDDEMGAFGFLLEAHRWKNLSIRSREFMPAGVRLLLIPAT